MIRAENKEDKMAANFLTALSTDSRVSDISKILEEAKNRWLRPSEVCEIIRNYQRFHVKPDPPYKPSGGSLFLFDRKTLRYFRKDGHRWRKKKDGKTVREAHEKLKSGSVDVLHCYYAHGEEKENFQRRSYWMLDGQLEHIVLVHYREVTNEGARAELADDSGSSVFCSRGPGFQTHSWGAPHAQPSYGSSPSTVAWSEQAPSSELDDVDSGMDLAPSPPLEPIPRSAGLEMARVLEDGAFDVRDFGDPGVAACRAGTSRDPPGFACSFEPGLRVGDCQMTPEEEEKSFAEFIARTAKDPWASHASEDEGFSGEIAMQEEGGSKRSPDSFWRWMSNEMGQEVCGVSLAAPKDSCNCWSDMDAQNDEREISSLSRELHLDLCSPGPWLSQEQLFSILDFSPDWAYSGSEATKVLIAGSFLGEGRHAGVRWSCMFGEVEVPAEALSGNALRCLAPPLPPGRVPLYVTRSNRVACSEIREFEYRDPREGGGAPRRSVSRNDEADLRMRLAAMLSGDGPCAVDGCPWRAAGGEWRQSTEDGGDGDGDGDSWDVTLVIERLLMGRLCEWLSDKSRGDGAGGGKGLGELDREGLGVIHVASALGYAWAMKPIIAAGESSLFRDARGWTALHWAAFFGREETAAALVALGSSPGALADPTVEFPHGRTAADLASSRGHKGISGYLAQADLAGQLSSLGLEESGGDGGSPGGEASGRSVGEEEQQQRGTLWAVRSSAQAAARIQSALRARWLRRMRPSAWDCEEDLARFVSGLVAKGNPERAGVQRSDALCTAAAARIQHKYRGWRGRRDFVKMRSRAVKIQAHVRGHQVRRQCRRFAWSVGVVEKAILRWRRGGCGLRGFKAAAAAAAAAGGEDEDDEEDFLRAGWKHKAAGVERALARVQSMARRPDARDQYMRMAAAAGGSGDGNGPRAGKGALPRPSSALL